MKRNRWLLLSLAVGLVVAGCVLTSGQIRISFDLDDFSTTTDTGLAAQTIDLNTESEYKDNKDKLKDLSDLAVLGEITNNLGSPINVEIWMTPTITNYTTAAEVTNSGSGAVRVWGPFNLAGNATKKIGWDDSAKLFSAAGKKLLLDEAKGDGQFQLYAIAPAGAYDFGVAKGVLVLVLDVGI